MKTKSKYIQLEPRETFDKAIVKVSDEGEITYSYYKLVDCVCEQGDFSYEDACEYVDYNIVNLAINGFKVSYNKRYSK